MPRPNNELFADPFAWQAVYPPGVGRTFDPPRQPLWRFLADAAARAPNDVALTCNGGPISFATLWDSARTAGTAMLAAHAAGMADGGRVLVVLPNCPEFVAATHGALAGGFVAVAASPHLTGHELVPMLRDAAPGVVVCDATRRDEVAAAIRASGVQALRIDVVPGRGFGEIDLDGAPGFRPVESAADAVAVLQYTSGTTGGLKAAAMTHANLVANALQNNVWFSWTRDDVILGALPLQHTWGMCCVMNAALAAGARVVLLPHFDPAAALDAIERERVSVAYGSATMFHRLLDAAGAEAPRRFASLRYVKAGAMLVGSDLYARWTAAVPDVPMVNGYGLTEASPEVTNNPPRARRCGTVGVPLPGTELRLGVVETPDVAAAPGAEGEVQIRGPQVMSGYWRNPEATREAFTSDGWLRTGDLATFDEAGYLVIRDRLKDLIKYRGWSVVPGEVEKALREHPAVAEACVVGVPDPRDGETPVAYVVLRPGSDEPDADGWRAHLVDRLATYKHPRRYVVVPEIPKNHVGKPLRRELRARRLP